eukprot:m.96932 g.96932  ORF g.96932 m.96932 type:complete len:129 (+) comp15207_c0_seq1:923-1309(+)
MKPRSLEQLPLPVHFQADPHKLVVIEKDKRMLPFLKMLEEAQPPGHTRIVHGDALGFDYEAHLDQQARSDQQHSDNHGNGNAPVKVIGNLPFGVATPILLSFLRDLSYGTGPELRTTTRSSFPAVRQK